MAMDFEWDETKSDRTRRERGVGFDYAVLIFEGLVLEWEDRREDWGETRIVAAGTVEDVILTVIYTDRGKRRRIISARKARQEEREAWLSYVDLLKSSGS